MLLTLVVPMGLRDSFVSSPSLLTVYINDTASHAVTIQRSSFTSVNDKNNLRLLKQIDTYKSLTIVRINVYDGQSPPRQMRVSSLPTAVTRWGDKVSTQLSRPGLDLWSLDPKSGICYQLRHRASY